MNQHDQKRAREAGLSEDELSYTGPLAPLAVPDEQLVWPQVFMAVYEDTHVFIPRDNGRRHPKAEKPEAEDDHHGVYFWLRCDALAQTNPEWAHTDYFLTIGMKPRFEKKQRVSLWVGEPPSIPGQQVAIALITPHNNRKNPKHILRAGLGMAIFGGVPTPKQGDPVYPNILIPPIPVPQEFEGEDVQIIGG